MQKMLKRFSIILITPALRRVGPYMYTVYLQKIDTLIRSFNWMIA